VPEVSVEQLIGKALKPLSAECITQGCRERIGGQKVQNCERTVQELIKQEVYSDNAKLGLLLKVLEWNRTCITHHSSTQFTCVAAWKESVMAKFIPAEFYPTNPSDNILVIASIIASQH
jgi:hypothetical protein